MTADQIINSAVIADVLKKDELTKVPILSIKECLSNEELIKLNNQIFEKNRCLNNAYKVLEQLNLPCCEGIAYVSLPDGSGYDWIKHCWNVKHTPNGDIFFDVGMELAYLESERPLSISYYLVGEFNHSDYKRLFKKDKMGGFISNADIIEEKVKTFMKENNII